MTETQADSTPGKTTARGWLGALSLTGALLAASCCIVPLVLVSLGISAAWVSQLHALLPYRPYFLAVTLVFLALGFWHVYFRSDVNCEKGSYCARPGSSRWPRIALWTATILALLVLTLNWWAPWFY